VLVRNGRQPVMLLSQKLQNKVSKGKGAFRKGYSSTQGTHPRIPPMGPRQQKTSGVPRARLRSRLGGPTPTARETESKRRRFALHPSPQGDSCRVAHITSSQGGGMSVQSSCQSRPDSGNHAVSLTPVCCSRYLY
jgi:hypothetical protein